MDESVFPQLQRELGSLDARLATLETLMSDVRDALKQLAANETRLSHLERDRIQHDKRIVELESELHKWEHILKSVENMLEQMHNMETRCAEHAHQAKTIEEHIKNDKSVNIIAGEWALRILMFAGGAFGIWLIDRIPKILELLK